MSTGAVNDIQLVIITRDVLVQGKLLRFKASRI